MATISRARPMRTTLAACAATAALALSVAVPSANAGLLDTVTGQVEEVTAPLVAPVQAAPTVQEAEAAVTGTVGKVTAGITPPTHVATPHTPEAPPSATHKPDGLAGQVASTVSAASSTVGTTTRTAGGAAQAVTEEATRATGTTIQTPPVASTAAETVSPEASASQASDLSTTAAPTNPPTAAPRTTYVPPPTNNGSTGSPLPRWVAYVWPAVALTEHSLASFGERWGQAIVRLSTGTGSGPSGEGGVAGVHASGGDPAAGGTPLFARLPASVAHAFSSVPTPALVYLGLLILAVIAVALGVRHEILVGRRHSRF